MALECFTQVLGSLFDKICRGDDDDQLAETFRWLPDCLIIDILTRLPIRTLARCRRDCRDLRALISSHYFTTLHLSRARPLLLLHHDNLSPSGKGDKHLYVSFANKHKFTYPYLSPQPALKWGPYYYSPHIVYSCQGVLLFMSSSWWPPTKYYVLNPITLEEVFVRHTFERGRLCALYFSREFKLLYAQIRGSFCQYLVYIFKTRTWRKTRSSANFNFLPYSSSTVVNGALHWIIYADLEKKGLTYSCQNNGIIVFTMDKEELSVKPHPGSVCNTVKEHKMMTLFVKENHLSFCHLLFPEPAVDIWILEDYEMWAWNKRYKVKIPFGFPYGGEVPIDMYQKIKLFYNQDGELLLYFLNSGCLYFYNLDHKTGTVLNLPNGIHAFGAYIKSVLPIA
ncbi:putative F-box/kelch-repeat protein At1g12870 [Lycium barbarum]|uniref:putative F-box/kelch-repeat protein At1g12870 n=1 Tax=Lycium barbarum TaxID=112863 RepID=UPI00293ED64D|nr:putative F-box/kelch-repeat protein At1g12870 [Lycium barbarum]